ncbi:MAG: sulfurtransferase TusA family protein [Methylococcales bacterium]|jgi:tRNA 2-thiouridine synthesizing protein A|nr:sulfurtransferase TusA family protein [Methylococcales bacterium]MBT7410916.1 sulfurtransferase TusA family protein [Methylococcales bacterium]
MEYDRKLDATAMTCPMPIMQSRRILKEMKVGEILYLIASDADIETDISALVESLGAKILQSYVENGQYQFYIKKG